MAAFQFTIQQVSFPSEKLDDSSSLDSLGSVVDPNIDFITGNDKSMDEKDSSNSFSFQDKRDDVIVKASCNNNKLVQPNEPSINSSKSTSLTDITYPTIPLAVAEYINKNNPTLFEEAEKYLSSETLKKSTAGSMFSLPENPSQSSPLRSLSVASEALALQQSVIGNFGVKPVSADVVAQVVENTKRRMEQGNCSSVPSENSSEINVKNNSENFRELIRYPSESITSTVEKRSWFSNSSVEVVSDFPMKSTVKNSVRENTLSSRNSSQNNINNVTKKHGSSNSCMPKVHSSKAVNSKTSKNDIVDVNSPYEIYPDSSVEYETESSISEKFEAESLCSEAYETESNFSEVSGIDDEMFQIRRSKHTSKSINHYDKMINNGTQVDVITSHANTSPIKSPAKKFLTSDKAVETDEFYHFQLMREKANLEGRLESVSLDQTNLVKERDHFRSVANSNEAQIKSLQKQLDSVMSEKKNALQLLDTYNREQKNWDNVIKEYQSIIETKNEEIKGLKEDLSESEQLNTRSKINYEELKVEMESKEGAITGLKKKIAELHVEVQVILQNKIQLENEVKNVRLEMETLQKSKEWFQEQLHSTQDNRNKLHQELISVQSSQISTSNSMEKLIAEKNQLRQELIQTQQRAVAEKEVLMKHLETIEADMKERESLFDEIQKDKGTAEAVLVERIRKLEEEKSQSTNLSLALSDNEYRIKVLKSECEEKTKLIETLNDQKVEFTKQIAILQKSFNDKDMINQQLNQQIKDLNVKISHLEMALSHSEELVNALKDERTATDVALASANEEKRIVNESLKSVSENLNKFKHNFKIMKADLVTKTSQAEQLMKEKLGLEEALKKSEDSMFTLRKEFEQQVRSENQNHDVLLDDLQKRKNDIENVLSVYSKDLLNYQQIIENLTKEKAELSGEITSLRSLIGNENLKANLLKDENSSLRYRISELEELEQNLTNKILETSETLKEGIQAVDDNKKTQLLLRTKKVLYKKLKEKIKECEDLKNELQIKATVVMQDSNTNAPSEPCHHHPQLLSNQETIQELTNQLEELQKVKEEQVLLLKRNENIIIELEREKGKAVGFAEKYENLKQHLSELEAVLGTKDSEIIQLSSEVKTLKDQLSEQNNTFKNQIANLESYLNKDQALVKNLRQQIFQEKRLNSHLQRDMSNMKSALEQTNQIADGKKQEIESLQAELSVKMQAELKHRAEIEHFQTEIRLQQSIAEKLSKELEEVKARDPALAEQIKAISWKLKERTNEALAFKEKLSLLEERNKLEIENLKKILQASRTEIDDIKAELKKTRDEKFSYQAKVIELRKALKSKLSELESKGILRIDNKTSDNGPVIHLNVPDPEISFDETYVNNLLQKSMHLTESRPLSNLQECLNSLKEEMVHLQKKIIENAESS